MYCILLDHMIQNQSAVAPSRGLAYSPLRFTKMAIIKLHVWGAVANLPSIDAECLGAIALLHHILDPSEWRLVQSSDPGLSPSGACVLCLVLG